MRNVTEALASLSKSRKPLILADVSPPRGGSPEDLNPITAMRPDFYCVAYAPGRGVRPDPVSCAAVLATHTGIPSVVNLATRDMNALALSNFVLGAHVLGIRSIVVLGGDDFSRRDLQWVQAVRHLKPTELIRLIQALKTGKDFRGASLASPISTAVGATIDLGRGVEKEAALAIKKAGAGAGFFITQPIYSTDVLKQLRDAFTAGGRDLPPILAGVDVPTLDGVTYSSMPETVQADLQRGRSGVDIALEAAHRLAGAGVQGLYVVAPIKKGGARDYAAAAAVIDALRK